MRYDWKDSTIDKVVELYKSDSSLGSSMILMLRNKKHGFGERYISQQIFKKIFIDRLIVDKRVYGDSKIYGYNLQGEAILRSDMDNARRLLDKFVRVGRYKDIFDMVYAKICEIGLEKTIEITANQNGLVLYLMFNLVRDQLFWEHVQVERFYHSTMRDGIPRPSISNLAKWMPNCQGSNKDINCYQWFAGVCRIYGISMSEKKYRKMTVEIKTLLNFVETHLNKIDYDIGRPKPTVSKLTLGSMIRYRSILRPRCNETTYDTRVRILTRNRTNRLYSKYNKKIFNYVNNVSKIQTSKLNRIINNKKALTTNHVDSRV